MRNTFFFFLFSFATLLINTLGRDGSRRCCYECVNYRRKHKDRFSLWCFQISNQELKDGASWGVVPFFCLDSSFLRWSNKNISEIFPFFVCVWRYKLFIVNWEKSPFFFFLLILDQFYLETKSRMYYYSFFNERNKSIFNLRKSMCQFS